MFLGSKEKSVVISRGQEHAKKYEQGSELTCQRYFVISEPYYYIRVSAAPTDPLLLYPEECGMNTCSPEYYTSNYYMPYLLCYLQQGSLVLNVPNKTYFINAGDCFFIDTSHPHIYYNNSDANTSMLFMHIGGREAGRYYELITKKAGTNVFHPSDKFVSEYLHFIIRFCTNAISDPLLVSSGIINLLAQLSPDTKENKDNMDKVLNYIKENYDQDISLDTLCELANLSKSRLINNFKRAFGYTSHQYILNTRLAMAYHKLINSRLSIEELAFSVGFNSSPTFIEAFKKKYGASPGKIRSENKRPENLK